MTLQKNHRLTETAYSEYHQGTELPGREFVLAKMKEANVPGRSTTDFTAFASRGRVTKEFAVEFTRLAIQYSQSQPTGVKRKLEGVTFQKAFNWLFEEISDSDRKYVRPQKDNDPIMKGVLYAASGAIYALFKMIWKSNQHRVPDLVRSPEELDEFLRHNWTEVGYSESKKGERLTAIEAEERGRTSAGEDVQRLKSFLLRLLPLNKNAIRYCIDQTGERLGFSCVFPISDAAFTATMDGERAMFEYRDDDVVEKSNNVVLLSLGEVYKENHQYRLYSKRRALFASLLTHIAVMLDSDSDQTVKLISYEFTQANSERLKAYKFKRVKSADQERSVVVFDPKMAKPPHKYLMQLVVDLLWRIHWSAKDGQSSN